jgi:tetratricopeptide (TPR) repeat protein
VVRPQLAVHARFRARFAREVALCASVLHPRIVPVFDTGRLQDGRPFVVMALADHGSLAELLRMRPPLRLLLRILDQVLDALSALHARGLLHQDLKPGNVLLHSGAEGVEAWVADLGVAGVLTELTMDRRSISGTPDWMAPEQLAGRAQELGPWTDLYAVGLLLAATLGGGPVEEEPRALLERRLRPPPPLAADAPPTLAALVARLLDPDPRQRFDRAADVRRALAEAAVEIDGETVRRAALSRARTFTGFGTTTFSQLILPEAQEAISVPRRPVSDPKAIPTWNRVPPDPLPADPPEEPWAEDPHRTSLSLFGLREPPCAGREPQRAQLWELAREVVDSGQPRVALIIGEPGGGKSGLVESIARALEAGGYMETVELRYNQPSGMDDGYRGAVLDLLAPWNDTRQEAERRLARWLARDHQSTPEALAREAQALARWCGYSREGEKPVNAAVGLAFLYRHLDARAWRGGAALVIDDAHLAAEEGDGLAICEALLDRSVGERPVFAMATLSSVALEKSPALRARVSRLIEQGAVELRMERLADPAIAGLLSRMFGLAPALAEPVAAASRGSPLFATLVVRDWAARGWLARGAEDRWELSRPLDDALPRTWEELAARRITGALATTEDPAAAALALGGAALAGPEPPSALVRALSLEGLDSLTATGLVRHRGRRLTFEDSCVHREALRRADRRADIGALHQRLADAWERLGEFSGADVDLPHGRHRLLGEDPGRATPALLRAARTTLAEGRPALALAAAELSAQAADRTGMTMARAEARQRIAEALLELDRPAEVEQTLAEARKMSLDRRTRARLQVVMARAAVALGDKEASARLLAEAATTFEVLQDSPGLVDTAHGEAILCRLEGRHDAAAERFNLMRRMNRHHDPKAEIQALVGFIECRIAAGRIAGIDAELSDLRSRALASGDTRNIAQSAFVAGLLYLRRRQFAPAERHFQTARAIAATLGSDRLRLACEHHLGDLARSLGDLPAALLAWRRVVNIAEEHAWNTVAATAHASIAVALLGEARREEAAAATDRAEAALGRHPEHWSWAVLGLLRAVIAVEAGDRPASEAALSLALDRGAVKLRSAEVVLLLEQLSSRASHQRFVDLTRQAAAALAACRRVEGGLSLHPA